MTITSKFPGTCTACHGRISAGTKIEWAKGEGARHMTCPAARTAAPKARKAAAPKAPTHSLPTDQAARLIAIDEIVARAGRTRATRDDGAAMVTDTRGFTRQDRQGPALGEIVQAKRKGHTDRDSWVVVDVSAPHYHSEDECEDMDCFCGHRGWQVSYSAIRVAATEQETAERAAAEAAKVATEEARRLVTSALSWSAAGVTAATDTGHRPASPDVTWTDCRTTYDVAVDVIVAHDPGGYDDYRTSTRTLARAGHDDVVAAIRLLAGVR